MIIKSIKLRKANWQDYQYCYNLTKKNMSEYFKKYWGGWNPKVFRQNFNPAQTKILLRNNRRIGYYVVKIKEDCYYIENIQVSTFMRGKGIGTYIMNLIEKQVSKSNKKKIQLTVFKDNPAKRLYEKLGYVVSEDKGASVLMEKKL